MSDQVASLKQFLEQHKIRKKFETFMTSRFKLRSSNKKCRLTIAPLYEHKTNNE